MQNVRNIIERRRAFNARRSERIAQKRAHEKVHGMSIPKALLTALVATWVVTLFTAPGTNGAVVFLVILAGLAVAGSAKQWWTKRHATHEGATR